MAPVYERVGHRELYSAIGPGLRIRPYFSIPISRPNINLGKLALKVLELGALFHGFDVEQLKILDVDDAWLPIQQQKTVVRVGSQGICDPSEGNRPLILKSC